MIRDKIRMERLGKILSKIAIAFLIAYAIIAGGIKLLEGGVQALDSSDRAKLKTWVDRIELVQEIPLNDNCKLQHWRHYYGQPSVVDKQWILFYVTLCGETADIAIYDK